MMKQSRCLRFRGCILLFYFNGRTGNGGGLASLTRTVLPVGRCSTGPVIQRIRTWLLGAEKRFGALYVCIWYTGQALSQLQRLCPALPGVCQPPSSVRGTARSAACGTPCSSRRSAWYCQVLCANSFTSLAELCLHRAGEPALDCPIAEGRERVKGGEAACEALDASSGFCYQPASSSCTSRCFMLMYFFPPH